jgi:hypothetical protein
MIYFKGTIPTGVGIEEMKPAKLDFKIYPNPASNYVILDFDGENDIEHAYISVFTTEGKLVAERFLTNPKTTRLNFDFLPNGIYLFSVKSIDSRNQVKMGAVKIMIVND